MRLALAACLILAAAPALATPCDKRVAFVHEVIDRDLKVGFVGKGVHDDMAADLDRASAACSAGNDAAAQSTISATQRKHGYPVR